MDEPGRLEGRGADCRSDQAEASTTKLRAQTGVRSECSPGGYLRIHARSFSDHVPDEGVDALQLLRTRRTAAAVPTADSTFRRWGTIPGSIRGSPARASAKFEN